MVQIRKATIDDAELLCGLCAKTFVESHGHSSPPEDIEKYIQEKYSLPAIQEELNDPKNIYHILSYQDKAAGYSKILYDVPPHDADQKHTCKLERIYLLKNYYDLQLGKKLLEFNINLSKEQGQKGIWLFVWKGNKRAVLFYTKAGFKIIGAYDFRISETHSNPNHVMLLKL